MSRLTALRTLAALGPAAVGRVALYRLRLRAGIHPAQRLRAERAMGPFFAMPAELSGRPQANRRWDGKLRWFDWFEQDNPGDPPPDWFANPFAAGKRADGTQPWWRIGDFGAGDIKGVWELSRFGWLVAFATEAANGDAQALGLINRWLDSWAGANPPYRGVHWKCGQEASFRVLHLLLAALVLDQVDAPLPGLRELIELHLKRIETSLSYAIGQQNNHGTSEAAALFIGGSFLEALGDPRGAARALAGRRQLERLSLSLIEPDGGFSQYSLVYHRVMLDTYCLAEAWRRRGGLPDFSPACRARLAAATDWLTAMIDGRSGDGPNLGANDGARLMPLAATAFRDFRPTLQTASTLFRGTRAIAGAGSWDDALRWLGLAAATDVAPAPQSRSFDDSGFHVLRAGEVMACLRYPRFRFRPSQADALHLDLWVHGRNLLRDAGSFSYNDAQMSWFAGTGAHNTVEFDGRDQMPRLGRFLFGDWLAARNVAAVHPAGEGVGAAAGYRDDWGAVHDREVGLSANQLSCVDRIGGRFDTAVLRWRLMPGDYRLTGGRLVGPALTLDISAEGATPTLRLGQTRESLHYQESTELPLLEIIVDRPCRIETSGRF
jgi:hypothetical protein